MYINDQLINLRKGEGKRISDFIIAIYTIKEKEKKNKKEVIYLKNHRNMYILISDIDRRKIFSR